MRYYANGPLITQQHYLEVPWVRRVRTTTGWGGVPEIHVWIPWWCPRRKKVMQHIEAQKHWAVHVNYRYSFL